jgi:hypothetical protein
MSLLLQVRVGSFGASDRTSCHLACLSHPTLHSIQFMTLQTLPIHQTAAYDADGGLIGELGASSPPVIIKLPLPLPLCWSYLLLAAVKLRCPGAARRAAAQLMPLFVTAKPARPVWEQHPMDALALRTDVTAAAAAPLLRAFAQASLAHVAQLRSEAAAAAEAARAAAGKAVRGSRGMLVQHRDSRVKHQLALFKDCKRLLIAAEVRSKRRFQLSHATNHHRTTTHGTEPPLTHHWSAGGRRDRR